MYFLDKELTLSYKEIFSSGLKFYSTIFNKATNNRYESYFKLHKKVN
jgi:hypothetical protein